MTQPSLLSTDEPSPLATFAERLALLIVLAIVVARCTMLETIRDPLDIAPGADAAPAGPGATTAVVLSLLSVIPAMLVLARGTFDRSFSFTRSAGLVGLILLGAWALASAAWAADKFIAAVSAFNWLAAMTLAWATAQLVRTPRRARVVAGVGAGLLLVYIAYSLLYLANDLPALRDMVEKNRDQLIAQRGWTPDSFEARRFLQKVTAGELVGFSASPNTFAACVVMTMVLATGLALQRLRDGGTGRVWAALLGLPVAGAAILVYKTDSRTALATLLLAAALFVIVWRLGPFLRRHARGLFVAGAAGFGGVVAIIVWRGVTTGTLFHDSLTFRWRYWVGAWRVFREHPIVGVGWENFGPFYLAKRLAVAAEEPRDPHNFVVRFFTELGLVGGVLAVAAIGLVIWRMTRPGDEAPELAGPAGGFPINAGNEIQNTGGQAAGGTRGADDDADPSLARVVAVPLTVGAAAMLLNTVATIDWAQHFDYVDMEVRKRVLYAVLLGVGVLAGTMGVPRDDRRDVPWLRAGFVIATLLFLLQNLVDFSMFEPGGMALFALIAGSAVGLAGPAPVVPSVERRRWPLLVLAGVAVAWLVALFALAVPVGLAEADAATGDEVRRQRRPGAADHYAAAYDRVQYNDDYAYSVARSLLEEGRPLADFRRWIDTAVEANPLSVKSLLLSARVEAQSPSPDVARLRGAYERALQIDPQNPEAELEYGEALAKLGFPTEAADHLRRALAVNAAFHPDEPKRLRPERVAEIEARVRTLDGSR